MLDNNIKQKTLLWKPKYAWYAVTLSTALLVIFPILMIISKAFLPEKEIWNHLRATVLPIYIHDTFILTIGVALLSLLFGVSTAYIVSRFDFFARRTLEWLLILPLAMPTYLIAFIYTDLLEFSGPVQKVLREITGYESSRDYWFFEIRSMTGGILTMSLVLYPYVYLLCRTALLEQSQNLSKSARVLGKNRIQTFINVVLPMARPAIVLGVLLVTMEVLNDYGAVSYFAIHTFSEGVYDFWLGRNNQGGAAQIAIMLLFIVISIIILEQYMRRNQRYILGKNQKKVTRQKISGIYKFIAISICSFPVVFGFIIPSLRLVYFIIVGFNQNISLESSGQHLFNSLFLAFIAASATVTCALCIAYSRRVLSNKTTEFTAMLSSIGYAMPGAILAIGLMIMLGDLDRMLNTLSEWLTNERVGLFFSGTIFSIIIAYMIRFMSVAQNGIYSSLEKITKSMDYTAMTLGCTPSKCITRVHIPIIRKGLLTAFLIVFVDSMKELPATLILRPFNFDTLATHVYQYASDEKLEASAASALLIVLAGLAPILILNRLIINEK